MIIIQDILISDDVIDQHFHCNLIACKGACCWEGDFGAPLEREEMSILEAIYSVLAPMLTEKGRELIEKNGPYHYYPEQGEYGTPLLKNGACAYMTKDSNGIAQCGIEQAHKLGLTNFKKPISCHLYPIRVTTIKETEFEALNYDRWDICNPACLLGGEKKIPVYQFAKEGLIRKYGQDFYDELDAAANYERNRTKAGAP